MPSSRIRPLAGWSVVAAFVLIGLALLATALSTRASVLDASDALGRGSVLALEQAVRADIADLDTFPSGADLDTIVQQHADDGLRYIALVDGLGQVVASAGEAVGSPLRPPFGPGRHIEEIDGRLRSTVRAFRRMKTGGRAPRFVIEIDPVQASALREASSYTLGVGSIAALTLLGVAIVLVRREARRHADERARERERRLVHLGEMSAVLAHEIKNPLASLKGNAQLLASMLPTGDKPRAKADRVVDEAVRLEHITKDLLEFVRTGELKRIATDPVEIVRDAVAATAGVTLATTGAPARWSLDPARLRQIVSNLVDNAVAAGPPVTVALRAERGVLVLEVADHGPGVRDADREKIFEPFFTGKTHGTGLGLAVARRLVELHGGTLVVQTSPTGGALFRAEIPES